MTPRPLVTVAIVTYQFERFIARAIDSAFAMDWPADCLDVLVIDDGSTDATPEIVARYGDRVRYVHKANEGVVASVALSFELARGAFIAPLAGDDECMPDRLRRQVAVLEERPAVGLVYGDMELIDADSRPIAESFAAAMGLRCVQGRCLGPLLTRNTVSGGPALLRASMLEHVLPMPAQAVWEDWWTALKVAEHAEIAYLDAPVYRYRHHGNNMNLGAPPEKAIHNSRIELAFRRWVLSGEAVSFARVRAEDLREAFRTLDGQSLYVADQLHWWLDDVLAVSDADIAAAQEAWAAGDVFRALSFDPALAPARELLHIPEAQSPAPVTRADVTLVLLGDLIADPALFAGHAATTDADADATLVVYAPGADPIDAQARLLAAVPALADDDAPDVLLHATPRTWAGERALVARASRILRADAAALAA